MTKHTWLSVVAASALLLAQPALAQPAPAPAAEPAAAQAPSGPVEQIVVTGSRIGRDNLTEVGPLQVVTSEDIARSGITTIDELLLNIPSVSLLGISKNNNNGGNGLAQVDLRNLGIDRTLVLINGRRVVVNSSGVSAAVDLNNIPIAMIERVEVLLEGASAVYGSDAVGGVVNFITKDDFQGVEIDAYFGSTDRGDGETGSLSLTGGTDFDGERGNITFNATFYQRGEIDQPDRKWARKPITAELGTSTTGLYSAGGPKNLIGSSFTPPGTTSVDGITYIFKPNGGLSYQPFGVPTVIPGLFLGGFDNSLRHNYGNEQYLVGKQQRLSFMVTGDYLALEDSSAPLDDVKLYTELMFTHRESDNLLSGQPISNGVDGYVVPFADDPTTPFVETANPFIPADFFTNVIQPAVIAGTDSNILRGRIPFNQRYLDIGPRAQGINGDFWRIVGGITGEFLDEHTWDLFVNWGHSETHDSTRHSINQKRLFEAVSPARCALAPGCIVANVFGQSAKNARSYIEYTDTTTATYEEINAGFSLVGPVYELPAGALEYAVGFDYRQEDGEYRPDPVTVNGETSGNQTQPTKGDYEVIELFGELNVPIVSDKFLAYDMSANVSGRWFDYNTFGSDTTYRLALNYAPLEQVRIRGSYSTAFRAPGVPDLFGGSSESFEFLTDPCDQWDTTPGLDPVVFANCQNGGGGIPAVPAGFNQAVVAGTQIPTNIGGNTALQPEQARIWEVGLIFTPEGWVPSWLQNPHITVDWYDIDLDNAIENPDPQGGILNACYASVGLSFARCPLITRDPGTGAITRLEAINENIGKTGTTGFDFTMGFAIELGDIGLPPVGRVVFDLQGNHLVSYTEEVDGLIFDKEGVLDPTVGPYADWRIANTIRFERDTWAITSQVRWLSETINEAFPDPNTLQPRDVDSVVYWDLVGEYNLGQWRFMFGIENLTDTDPPFFPEGGQNANPNGYDFTGRFLFTRIVFNY